MSAKEYRTLTLVREIRSRGVAVTGITFDDLWFLSGHTMTWSKCKDWVKKHQNKIEAVMRKAAEDYCLEHLSDTE